ncbi:MAG: EamA family transporter [Candidatus Komeilibacteria bacterium]|nr:EamA family transporter [Candidatus Komeilibacteria bacterium]
MFWLWLTILAYGLNAVSMAINKALLSNKFNAPFAYTVFVGVLGLTGWILAPWGYLWPGGTFFWYSMASGMVMTFALLAMFYALTKDEVSRVTTVIASFSPLFIYFISDIFLGENLTTAQILALILIIVGGVSLSYQPGKRWDKRLMFLGISVLAALLFAIAFASSKFIYDEVGFIPGFIWLKVGTFTGAILLLLYGKARREIREQLTTGEKQTGIIFLGGQIAGALHFVTVNWAIALGSVTVVNALQGLQNVLVFLIAVVVSIFNPRLLHEEVKGSSLIHKSISIAVATLGVYLLFYYAQ